MVDTEKICNLMAENGLTRKDMAQALHMSANTFSSRMKSGIFKTNEIEKMIVLLQIKNPEAIFFAGFVSREETKPAKNN